MISKLILKGTEAALSALAPLYKNTFLTFGHRLTTDYTGVWTNDGADITLLPCNSSDTKVQQWCCTDTYEKYKLSNNTKYDADNITYRTNGIFRIADRYTNAKKHIACFGCSNTFGVGLPYEKTWPYLLNKKIGTDYMCHNFGVNGGSADTICRLVYSLLVKEKPDVIICHFPDMFRIEYYNINDENIAHFGPWSQEKHEAEYKAYNLLTNEYVAFFNFVKNFKFIETLCKQYNVPFIWHTWSRGILSFDEISYENNGKGITDLYLNTDCIIHGDVMYDIVKQVPEAGVDRARDEMHLGETYNDILSTEFAKLLSSYN